MRRGAEATQPLVGVHTPTMKSTKDTQKDVSDQVQTTDIDAARAHLHIARSHIEQGFAHLAGDDDHGHGFTLTCEECDAEFDPWDVTRSLVGPHTALYSCPDCSNTVRGPEPYLRVQDDK